MFILFKIIICPYRKYYSELGFRPFFYEWYTLLMRHLSVGSLLFLEGFFSGISGFSFSAKDKDNSNSIWRRVL